MARATVKEIAYMGDLSIYLVQLTSGKIVRVTQPNTVAPRRKTHHLGRTGLSAWHLAMRSRSPGGGDRV